MIVSTNLAKRWFVGTESPLLSYGTKSLNPFPSILTAVFPEEGPWDGEW